MLHLLQVLKLLLMVATHAGSFGCLLLHLIFPISTNKANASKFSSIVGIIYFNEDARLFDLCMKVKPQVMIWRENRADQMTESRSREEVKPGQPQMLNYRQTHMKLEKAWKLYFFFPLLFQSLFLI